MTVTVDTLTEVQRAAVQGVDFVNGETPISANQPSSVMGLTYGDIHSVQVAAGIKRGWHSRLG